MSRSRWQIGVRLPGHALDEAVATFGRRPRVRDVAVAADEVRAAHEWWRVPLPDDLETSTSLVLAPVGELQKQWLIFRLSLLGAGLLAAAAAAAAWWLTQS